MTNETKAPPALYLILDPGKSPDPMAEIRAAKQAGPVLSLLIRSEDNAPDKTLISAAQALGIAVLLEADNQSAPYDADGLHVSTDSLEAFHAAASQLQNDEILGVMAWSSRHNAMLLAEEGASYIAFDVTSQQPAEAEPTPDAPAFENQQPPTLAWWTELFETPAVAWGINSEAEALRAAKDGADFIALAPAFWQQGEQTGGIIAALCTALDRELAADA